MDQEQSNSSGKMLPRIGMLVAVAIIILVLGFWFMSRSGKMSDDIAQPQPGAESGMGGAQTPDAATEALKTQGTSDDLSAIQADLNATDLKSLDVSAI